MLFEDRFQVPPPPGSDREAPESYPAGREHLAMAMSGLGMLGMARMGLRSFGGDGDLFGVFGEKASDPMQAVVDFVREGRRIMNESDAGASSTSQAVLTTDAGSDGASKLDDTVEQIAATHSARRERVRSLSQSLTRQKIRSAIDQSFSRQSDPTDAEYRAARLVQEGTDDFSGTITPDVQGNRATLSGADRNVAAGRAMKGFSGVNQPDLQGRRRVLFGQTQTERRGRQLDELGEQMMLDPQRTGRGGPAEEALRWMGNNPEETLKDSQRALLSQMSVDAPHGIPEDVLMDAWRQWKQSHPFERKPMENPSAAEIARYAMESDEMLREVEKRVKRRNREQITTPDELSDLTGEEGVAGASRGVGYADPVLQGAFDGVDIDEIASYGELEASTVMNKDGVTEDLADRVRRKFDWMEEKFSGDLNLSLERVEVDDYHEMFRGTVQVGDQVEEFEIPLPSEYGTYKLPNQSRSFVSPQVRLPESDFFAGREAVEMIEETRGARVARPDELSLISISNFIPKMLNDLEGGRGPAAVEEFATRLRRDHFNKKSLVNDSVPDVLTKGLQVRTFAQDFFESVKGSSRKRQQVEQGRKSAKRLRNLFQRGDRYFASDTEFVSPDVMAERGDTGGAQTPYELSGQIMDPEQKSPVAEITYHPNLFENKPEGTSAKKYREKIKEGIKDFQSSHTSKSEEDINQLLDRLETGSLKVTVGGETHDLLDPNQEVPDFLPSKEKSETLDRYYTRVQNRLLDEFGADFSVGQNYLSSEHSIYKQLYEQTGVNMPKVLQESNVVDMMHIAHATGAIPTGSRSLGSIVGQLHGLDQTEARDVISTVNDKFGQLHKAVRDEDIRTGPDQAEKRMYEAMDDALDNMDASDEQRQFWKSMRETMFQGEGSVFRNPNSFDLHTAAFDAYMTGAFGARKMNEFLESTEGTIALERAEDVLNAQDEIAGDRNFIERHSGLRYDRPGEDDKGVDPFLVNQEAATMGAGSMVHSNALPFARLQNPVRQLYQRNKPRRLVSETEDIGPINEDGVPSHRRPRKPSRHMQRALRHRSKMKLFRQGEGVVEYDGPGIFAGFGTSTPRERQLRGGRSNEMRFGVTSRAAMVPRNTLQTWESQAQGTAARREALMGGFDVKTETVSVDPEQITDGMEDWVQTRANELGIDINEAESPEVSRQKSVNKKLLEEIRMLRQVLKDKESGATEEMRQLLRRAIETRQEAIDTGTPPEKSDKIRKALKEVQEAKYTEDPESPVMGDNKTLFDPSGNRNTVINPLRGPGNDNAVGIDVGVRFEDPGMKLTIDYIEDPGTVIKTNTAGAKTSTAAPVPGSSVGAFGEQVVMGAPFEKLKRKDFSGFIRAQVERIHRQVNDELQYLAQGVHEGMTGNEPFKKSREEVIERAARSLSKLAGDMSKEDVKKNVIEDSLYADYVDFDYTDEFVRQAEDATNMDIMNAAEEAGMTVRSTMKMAMDAGGASRKEAAQVMKEQVDKLIGELNSVLDEGLTPTEDLDIDTQLSTEQREQQIRDTIKELEERSGTYQELFSNKLESLDENQLTKGSLYDFFVARDTGQLMAGYQILSPEERTASPVTGGSQLGEAFEEGVGRATKQKRSSLLSTALMGHSAEQMPGGGGPAGDLFQAWLGAKSGAAAFSNQKFRREVIRELQQKGISVDNYDESNFEWNAEEQQLVFIHPDTGNRVALEANPFATLTQTQRARVGAVSMIKGEMSTETVAGHTIGGDDRVLSVKYGEDDLGKREISESEMHRLYGKEARAKQYYQFVEGKDPGDIDVETSKFDDPYVYFGEGARPGDSPIFSERFDFVEVNLHGDLADEELQSVAEQMEKAGISQQKIGRTLAGGEHFIESALTHGIEDPEEADRVRDLVQYIRSGEDKGFGGNLLMRTLTGEDRPNLDELGGGVQRASISRFQDLLESTEAITTVQESIRRIKDKADELDPEDPVDQRTLSSVVEQELREKMGAFREVEQLFAHTLKESVNHVTQQMEEMTGRYLGGEYSIAEPQTQVLPNLQKLAETAQETSQFGSGGLVDDAEELPERFVDEVRNLARKTQPRATGAEKFGEAVDNAAKDIYNYLSEQHRNYGDQYHKYQGFGVGEGFLARSKAQKIVEQMKLSHKNTDFGALQDDLEPVEEGTNLQGEAQQRVENLEQKAELEVRLAEQELNRPGSTPGVLTINARQPDFTMLANYETGRMSVMGDEAMQFLGMAPDQVHMMSNPLTTWSRREDFDFDLNYMAAISDSSVSAMMRETRAKGMPEQIALLHQVVEGSSGELRGSGETEVTREGPIEDYETGSYDYRIEGADETHTTRRVTTPFITDNETFDDPVASFFGFAGQARENVASSEEARRTYALQQSIVGQFGAYSKQGAVKTMQRETDFMNAVTQMVETAKQHEGADQSFSDLFKAPEGKVDQLKDMTGRKQMGDAWEFMQRTMKDVEAARSGALDSTGVFDPLHTAALAESEIAQGVAIEKYKSGDPQRQARRMNDILKTLHGNHRGGYSGFDEAMDALLEEDIRGMNVQDFFARPEEVKDPSISQEQLEKRTRQRARRAFRLQYNMNVSMQMLADQGITGDYLSDFANVAQSQIPMDQKLEQAVGGGAQSLQTDLPAAVAGALGADIRRSVDRFFASQSQRESMLESVIGRPSTYEEQARQMLDDMPASVKRVGLGAAAGAAVLGLMDGPDSQAEGETFDTPQDRYEDSVYGSNHTAWSLDAYQSSRRELDFQMRERASAGRTRRARRPPTITADY